MARVPKMTRGKTSLAHGIQCRPNNTIFNPTRVSAFRRIKTYIHISGCVEIVYELLLLINNSSIETFLHKSGAVRCVSWIFIPETQTWPWLGEYVMLDTKFWNLLFKQDIAAAPVTPILFFLSHSSRTSFGN